MSGYLKSSRPRSVNTSLNWDVTHGTLLAPAVLKTPIVRTESLTTFRSGDRYQRDLDEGAKAITPTTLLDRAARALGDTGHDFDHIFVSEATSAPRVRIANNTWQYTGPMLFSTADPYFTPDPYATTNLGMTPQEMDVFGTSAIAQVYPTKPNADLMVAIAELLREGLPSALFSAVTMTGGNSGRQLVRDLSSDYLNLLFGVTPIVREIDKLIKTVQTIDQHIAQLVRDSGRAVRRTYTPTMIRTRRGPVSRSKSPTLSLANGVFGLNAFVGRIPVEITETLDKRAWFVGSFRYMVPGVINQGTDNQSLPSSDLLRQADIRLQIAGMRATPKAAWNLLPFSWLVDWLVNVSDFFEVNHAFANYDLVMRYGYVMSEQTRTTTTTYDFRNTSLSHLGSVTSTVTARRQQRRRATPFGFGLKDADMNPLKWSILGALALSNKRV